MHIYELEVLFGNAVSVIRDLLFGYDDRHWFTLYQQIMLRSSYFSSKILKAVFSYEYCKCIHNHTQPDVLHCIYITVLQTKVMQCMQFKIYAYI